MKNFKLAHLGLIALGFVLAVVTMRVETSTVLADDSKKAETKIAPTPKVVSVMSFDKVDKKEFPWGWIRWIMNSEIDKDATMTYGMVEIEAGKSNPLHLHPNCEEYLYVLSGSCEHVLGDKTVILKAGDVIRIPQSVPHKAKALGKEPMKAVIVYNSGSRKIVILEKGGKE